MTIRKYIYPLAAAMLIGMAATSCVSDDTESPVSTGEATVGITITAAPLGSSTRAFEDSEKREEPAQSNELINNWFVVFRSTKTGKIVAVESGEPGAAVWNDKIQTTVPTGTYSILAFANMDNEALKKSLITKDNTLVEDWQKKTWAIALTSKESKETENTTENSDAKVIYDGAGLKGQSLIPMSGYIKEIQVKNTINEEFSIEVVRMLCKVQFAVKNESKSTVSIDTIKFQPLYNGDIYLFPNYSQYNGLGRPTPNTQTPAEDWLPRIPVATTGGKQTYEQWMITTNPNLKNLKDKEVGRSTFYIKESIADGNHSTNRFHIGLSLKRDNQTKETVSYALASQDLKFFYRNDYVLFPIVISDYTPEIEVYDYPPIGGYPVQVTSSGNEFYATFSSSGAFDILARLKDSEGRTVAIQPYKENETSTQQNYVKIVDKPDNLTLEYDPYLGLWKGDFDYKQGENKCLEITFEFKIGNLTYTRTLYLLS